MNSRYFGLCTGTLGGLGVLALLSLVIAALGAGGEQTRALLAYDRGLVEDGAVYRLLSANLVHLNTDHLRMNIIGVGLVALVLFEVLRARGLMLAIFWSGLGTVLGLHLLAPDVGWYVGFSGALHGLFVWGGAALVRSGRPVYGALVIAGVILKLVWEQVAGPVPGAEEAVSGRILIASHLYGALGGAVSAVRWRPGPAVSGLVLAALLAPAAQAHRTEITVATLQSEADGTIALDLETYVAAFALREPFGYLSDGAQAHLAAMSDADLHDHIAGASAFLLSRVRLLDGEAEIAPETIRYPDVETVRREGLTPNAFTTAPLVQLRFAPDPALADRHLRLRLPAMLGDYRLVVRPQTGAPLMLSGHAGDIAPDFTLGVERSWLERAGIYLSEGVAHVLPQGWDHVLFMAALVLGLPTFWQTFVQGSVFTVAHSVTLALAAFGVIGAGGLWVEIAIAASIALMGLGNLVMLRRGDAPVAARWRLAVIFGFGLVHGMGFAAFFQGLALEPMQLVLSLAAFNVGVEIGQVAVLLAVLLVIRAAAMWRAEAGRAVQAAGSVIVLLAGLYWTLERIGLLA